MEIWKYKLGIVQLQVLVWVAVLLLVFFSLLPMDGFGRSVIYTIVNTTSYAVIIYGNIFVLYPLFYEKRKYIYYGLLVTLLLVATGILRGYASIELYKHFLGTKTSSINLLTLLGYVPGGILIYVLSLVYRVAIAYFSLKQQTEEILLQKSQAELNLLKSQVQPHFLFNTLNNIYYKVYKVDPLSAGLIERLSDIMRYFVDESPKDVVPLATEVAFIENYMALEKIRIRHGAAIDFEKTYDAELRIPPMLLMTFVENIFKHGIDKTRRQNVVTISLVQKDGYLLFKTSNRQVDAVAAGQTHGFGIVNLTRRLKMLYGSKFELKTGCEGELFTAFLKIPLS
ncbi:MAG: sensor histidine kinase [Bacteroidetes bacterium]|nr:sensor histidine kinase [Bacteroidota bacterium]